MRSRGRHLSEFGAAGVVGELAAAAFVAEGLQVGGGVLQGGVVHRRPLHHGGVDGRVVRPICHYLLQAAALLQQ